MQNNTGEKTLYIIDAHGLLHKAYHAMPRLTGPQGDEVGALYGFTRMVLKIIKDKRPDLIAVCFDSPAKTFRHSLFSDYKANRPKTDDALVTQLSLARELTRQLGLSVFAEEGFEADDLIAALAFWAQRHEISTVLVTSDKDVYQLVNDRVSVWPGGNEPVRKSDFVMRKYGVTPAQMTDYFSLVGDASDNVPGIKGLGPKTAQKLLERFGTLDNIFAAARGGSDFPFAEGVRQKILSGEGDALLSRRLVTLCETCRLEVEEDNLRPAVCDDRAMSELFSRYGFRDFLVKPAASAAVSSAEVKPAELAAVCEEAKKTGKVFLGGDGIWCCLGAPSGAAFSAESLLLKPEEKKLISAVLSDAAISKFGHNIKDSLHQFMAGGEKLDGKIFDTAVAAYCLNPTRTNFEFQAVAADYLKEIIAPSFPSRYLLFQNLFIWRMADILSGELVKNGLDKLYQTMEMPLLPVLFEMERTGIKTDPAFLRAFAVRLENDTVKIKAEIEKEAGMELNLNSPKQIAFLLFEKMGMPAIRKTKTGYSTDEETLTELALSHPFVGRILDYREAVKLKSTYVDNLLVMADANGRIHTTFSQTATATGRLSSLRPNLQNIPVKSEYGKLVRRAFIAPEGSIFLSADYSQIDLRVLAHETGDAALCDAFRAGGDIHARTAAEVFAVHENLVSSDMRRAAKAINFGIIYGQTAMGLAQELGISRKEAQQYIDHYFQTYSGVKEWISRTIENARAQDSVRTLSGRVRYFPEFKSGKGALAAFAQRAAVNTVIQGGSADIIKMAMLALAPKMHEFGAAMLLQIHDELLFEVPAANAAALAAAVKSEMENCIKLSVPLVATLKQGRNWGEMEKLK